MQPAPTAAKFPSRQSLKCEGLGRWEAWFSRLIRAARWRRRISPRYCEERSEEAIQSVGLGGDAVHSHVPDALQRETLLRRAGTHATRIAWRDGPRLCSAPLLDALRPGHESGERRTPPSTSSLRGAKRGSNPECHRGDSLDCFRLRQGFGGQVAALAMTECVAGRAAMRAPERVEGARPFYSSLPRVIAKAASVLVRVHSMLRRR